MPSKRNKNKKRGSTKGGGKSFRKAPLQGLDTEKFVFNDVQVCILPQSASPGSYTLKVALDCNGFAWVITESASLIASYPTASYFQANQPYGTNANQFSRWAQLYAQYRLDKIECQVIPSGSGPFSSTGVFHCVDPIGIFQENDVVPNLVQSLSAVASVSQCTQYQRAKRSFNYINWLGQTQDTAWKQTQAPGTPQIVREQYTTNITDPSGSNIQRTPGLAFFMGFSTATSQDTFLCTVRIRSHFSFRQRNVYNVSPFLEGTGRLTYQSEDGSQHCVDVEMKKLKDARVIPLLGK